MNKYMVLNKPDKVTYGSKLADALGMGKISPEESWETDAANDFLVNWGCSKALGDVNTGLSVGRACHKHATLVSLWLKGIPMLHFKTLKELAKCAYKNSRIYCRTLLKSSQGKGIIISDPPHDNLPDAPLYTKAFPTKYEFRAHVAFNNVIDLVEKKRMRKEKLTALGLEEPDMLIRSHKRGWVFARNDLHVPELHGKMRSLAVLAVAVLGLDFGAVDILVGDNGDIRICEVNTAPGITGTTFTKYVEAFQAEFKRRGI